MSDPSAGASNDPTPPETLETSIPEPPDEQPGIRARALIEVHKRALNQTLKGCTADKVVQCFPSAKRAVLRDVHKQLVEQYEKLGMANFHNVLSKYDTIRKLNELDVLIDEAKARKTESVENGNLEEPVPSSTLPPNHIISTHLLPSLLKAQTLLSDKLDRVQSENEQLMDTIERQEAEIKTLVRQLEKVVSGMDGAIKVVRGCIDEPGELQDKAVRLVDPTSGKDGDRDGDVGMMGA